MTRNRRFIFSLPIAICVFSMCFSNVAAQSDGVKLQMPEFDACFSALSQFDYGKELTPLRKLSAYVESLESGSDQARQVEARLIAVLESESSVAAKQFACRQLGFVGGDAALPALEKLLAEASMTESALYALEQIPGSDGVLREALAKSSGAERTPLISTLGRRHDPEAVVLLSRMTLDKDPAVSRAAIRALGLIGTWEAASVLLKAKQSVPADSRRLLEFSLLECGERLASTSQQQKAASIFGELNKPEASVEVRFGALRGLSRLPVEPGSSDVLPGLIDFIRKQDPKAANNAIQVLLGMPGSAPVQALAPVLPTLEPLTRKAAILALADREDGKTAVSSIVQASRDSSPEVRSAAWTALGRLGDSSHVPLLGQALVAAYTAERTAARLSLNGMNCPDFDSALLGFFKKADGGTKIEIMGVIDERRMASAADILMVTVNEGQGKLRGAALKALRKTASENQIRPLVDLLSSCSDPAEGPVLAETVASLLERFPSPSHIGYVSQSYRADPDASRQARLVAGLRGVGNSEALTLLKEAMTSRQPELQRSAILSLSDWPNPAPIEDLLALAGQGELDASLRTLALRGCVRLVSLPAGRSHGESVAVLRQVFELAPALEEKKAVLALLERFPSPEAVRLGESALADPALSAEATAALEHLRAEASGDARLLVYTRNYASNGEVYVHDNIASSVAAIEQLGRENGFSIDVSDQPSVFTEDNLKQYKAIVFCNSNNEAFENDNQRDVFQRYIRRGGGFVGVHSACASEPKWPWFWSLVGGTFDFHPPFQPFTIRVLDKNHPSTAFFEGETWAWEDEFYFLKERNGKVRVLLAGEVKSLTKSGDNPEKLTGQPDPCPLVWCHEFEGGRAWYTALGHQKEHYQDPVYLRHLLGGILWVIGKK